MTRSRPGHEECSKKLCIAMTPSEYKMIEDARQALIQKRGRNVTMREIFVDACRTAFYESDLSRDKLLTLDDIMKSIAAIRSDLNNITNGVDILKEDLYGYEDEE